MPFCCANPQNTLQNTLHTHADTHAHTRTHIQRHMLVSHSQIQTKFKSNARFYPQAASLFLSLSLSQSFPYCLSIRRLPRPTRLYGSGNVLASSLTDAINMAQTCALSLTKLGQNADNF